MEKEEEKEEEGNRRKEIFKVSQLPSFPYELFPFHITIAMNTEDYDLCEIFMKQ